MDVEVGPSTRFENEKKLVFQVQRNSLSFLSDFVGLSVKITIFVSYISRY